MFDKGVKLIIPGMLGCAEHDRNGMFVPSEADGTDWEWAVGEGWGLV
jgi:hypothetical protein